MEALIPVAERGGPTMFARIGVMRALNPNVKRVFDPDSKEVHWGKWKLKRDQRPTLGANSLVQNSTQHLF
jgi:hypothetical protein